MSLKYPIVVLDFEASALTPESFPIEVGVASAAAPGAPIATWSSLIKPAASWDAEGQWDPDAERLHGIRRWALREGMEPHEAMMELNARIPAGAIVWCDGGHYDARWLEVLADAAGVRPTFQLQCLSAAFGQDGAVRDRYLALSGGQRKPHRAGPDAALVCGALAGSVLPHGRA